MNRMNGWWAALILVGLILLFLAVIP